MHKDPIQVRLEWSVEDECFLAYIKFEDGEEHMTHGDTEAETLSLAAELVSLIRDECLKSLNKWHCYCRPGNPNEDMHNRAGMHCCYCETWIAEKMSPCDVVAISSKVCRYHTKGCENKEHYVLEPWHKTGE